MLAASAMAPALWSQQVSAADPPKTTRIIAGVTSADEVMGSLEHVVVKLADKKKVWETTIKENIEIFLIGVSTKLPVRFDVMMAEEEGMQQQMSVPLQKLDDFLKDNLDPIGIEFKRSLTDKDLYKLSGNVYEGWLRNVTAEGKPAYAVIYPKEDGVPKGMTHPQEQHETLAKAGVLAFVKLNNAASGAESRKKAFEAYTKTVFKDFQKLSTETQDEFALRKRMREQSLAVTQQWFMEVKDLQLIANVDRQKNEMPAELQFSALPDTNLYKEIESLATKKSLFGAITAPDNAVLTARIFMALDDNRTAGYRQIIELMRPVMQKRLADDANSSAKEKAARQKAMTGFFDAMKESLSTPLLDAFIDVYPTNGKHTIVMAVETSAQAKILEVVDTLEDVREAWKLEKNVDKVGDIAIHKLNLQEKTPQALLDFYGNSRAVYIAVSPKAIWVAGGEESLNGLKSRLEAAAKPEQPAFNGTIFALKMHAQPVIKNIHEVLQQSDLQTLKSLNTLNKAAAAEPPAKDAKQPARPGGAGGAKLKGFKWQETAIAAMQGLNDEVELKLVRTGPGELNGKGNSHQGVLKALGAVIAKFAEENLQ